MYVYLTVYVSRIGILALFFYIMELLLEVKFQSAIHHIFVLSIGYPYMQHLYFYLKKKKSFPCECICVYIFFINKKKCFHGDKTEFQLWMIFHFNKIKLKDLKICNHIIVYSVHVNVENGRISSNNLFFISNLLSRLIKTCIMCHNWQVL